MATKEESPIGNLGTEGAAGNGDTARTDAVATVGNGAAATSELTAVAAVVAAIEGATPLMACATIEAGLMAGVLTRMGVGSCDPFTAADADPVLGFGPGVALAV